MLKEHRHARWQRVAGPGFRRALGRAGLVLVLLAATTLGVASGYQGGLYVNKLRVDGDGADIGFTALPTACDGTSWYNFHAELPLTHPNYESLLSVLLMARSSGLKIEIWFTDRGVCTDPATLLDLNAVGIAGGQN